MAVKTLLKVEYDLYNQLIIKSKQKTVFQTIPYLESLVKLGYSFEILGYFVLGELKYALPVQKKKIPFVNRFYYAIPYGIISEAETVDRDVLNQFIKRLKQKGWIINLSLQEKQEIPKFSHPTYHTTLMIDLNETLDLIFDSFSKTHRNCTRKAIKEGVSVRMSRDLNDIDLFIYIYESMLDEKSFDGIKPSLVRDIMAKLIESNFRFFCHCKL
ncbi:fem-like protein associated to methicillin resistance [Paracholeplasma brassicae]|uniref:Fem-like protein associated to methicillin resistance n=1 Tax=Acholeplasma brassicae TaxID=61635 RepID=U4KM98_9MOLU|nr:peptidoglycan bridge formation glycyltransferase FemA/FemB family protein [Paracholeplasma brassicae]CCV65141.1 fem-like protein associated to methicillin resistance [Paracholeplasma brassicae]